MPSKKAHTAKKKTVKTRTVSRSKTVKKTPARQVQKPKKTARTTAKPRKVAAKKPAPRAAAARAVVAKPAAAPKKKLTPREVKIQDIRKNLVMQKNELLSEAEEALNALPGQTIFPDMGDQASAEIDRNFMLRLRGREQRLLKKIEEAIEKIDSGVFGTCDVCGEEISLKRLEARPVTNMCIFCKTEQEEEEKMRGR